MLEVTKRYNEMLKRAGLKRGDYRIRTPFDQKRRGWGDTEIYIMKEKAITEEVLQNLLREELKVTRVTLTQQNSTTIYLVKPYRPQLHGSKKFEEYTV